MKTYRLENFKKGWLFGNFAPTLFKQEYFDIGVHQCKKGEPTTPHFHVFCTEWNLIISGKLEANGRELKEGDIFEYLPGDVSYVEFLEDTVLLVVKNPSLPTDKVIV